MFYGIEAWQKEIINNKIKERTELVSLINEHLYSPITGYRTKTETEIFIKGISNFEDVRYIRIIDGSGKIEASNLEEQSTIGDELLMAAKNALQTKKIITKDNAFNGEKVKIIIYPGYENKAIIIAFSIEKDIEDVQMWALMIYFSGTGALFIIFFFFFLILYGFVLFPVKKITRECEKIGKGELEGVSLNLKSSKEMKDISESFNKMVTDVKDYKEEIEEQRAILAIKVNARTRELGELNEKLENEVKERTSALEKKLDENERINKLMVGRELKMVELKNKISAAEEEIKKLKGE